MNDNIQKEVITLPPFKRFCMTIGELPSSYVETMTYYEMVLWFTKYLSDTIIPTVNNNAEAVTELQNLFVELQTYVNNYFDNLDVQEEINNKLDEMATDGTLEELIGEYLTNKLDIIFPKFWANSNSGDISLIKYKNKNILIDTYDNSNWLNVKEMLDNNNVTHIDYMIITHYDSDHYTNFENLFNNDYIDNNTNYYMPADVTKWSEKASIISNMKSFFADNNLTYYIPYENEIVNIDDLSIKFYNTNTTALEQLYTDYNDTSTVVLFTYGNQELLFAGDCGRLAYKRMYDNNFIKSNVQLFKVGHHGININTDKDFINLINPENAVIIAGINDFSKGLISYCSETSIMKNLDTNIYLSCIEENYLSFSVTHFNTICENGEYFCPSNYEGGKDIYIDINTNNSIIQNGSQNNPFKEIIQALGSINMNCSSAVNLHLADGEYCSSFVSIVGTKNSAQVLNSKDTIITITGNSSDKSAVTINTSEIINSFVEFSNLTIKGNNKAGIEARNSKILLSNVDIISNSTGTKYDGVILRENSSLTGSTVTFDNLNRGLILRTGSSINLTNVTFKTLSGNVIEKDNDCNSIVNTVTFTDTSKFYPFKIGQYIPIYDDLLYSGSTSQGITLNRQTNYYDWFKIDFEDSDGIKGTTGKIKSGLNNTQIVKTFGSVQKVDGNNIIISQCNFQVQGQNVSFVNSRQITIDNTGNVSVTGELSNYIVITRITAGFNNELNKA